MIERNQTFRQGRGVHGLHVRTAGSPSVLGRPGCNGTQRNQKESYSRQGEAKVKVMNKQGFMTL